MHSPLTVNFITGHINRSVSVTSGSPSFERRHDIFVKYCILGEIFALQNRSNVALQSNRPGPNLICVIVRVEAAVLATCTGVRVVIQISSGPVSGSRNIRCTRYSGAGCFDVLMFGRRVEEARLMNFALYARQSRRFSESPVSYLSQPFLCSIILLPLMASFVAVNQQIRTG